MGRKEFIWFTDSSPSSEEAKAGNSRQGLKQRPQRTITYWLSSQGLFSFFPIQCRTTCLGGDTTHSGLGCTTSVINQENALKTLGQSNEGISQLKFLLLNLTLACVKLPENQPVHLDNAQLAMRIQYHICERAYGVCLFLGLSYFA